jgi:hypothetical protein
MAAGSDVAGAGCAGEVTTCHRGRSAAPGALGRPASWWARRLALPRLAPALAALAAACCQAEPTYLIILGQPEEFAAEFPPAAPGSERLVGFGPVLYTLKTPSEPLVTQVNAQFDKAERTGYPVLIHLDDWNYPSPSTDPEVVEWTAFPAEGESHGPLVRRRWINWGSWFVVEAPPNYESRSFRAEVHPRFSAVARAIAVRLERWRAEGRSQLFAGLVVGWESGYYTADDVRPGERPRAGAESFGDDEIVRTGYAALSARGHTAASVREAARQANKPEAQVLRELMFGVVHDYIAFLTSVCRAAGVPSERIYTHYTGVAALPPESMPGPLREDGRNLPLWAAVNGDSRPGITATVPWTDVGRAAAMFREAGRGDWGAVEVEFTEQTRAEDAAFAYLDSLSTNGARVVCVYGWWDPPGSTFGVRGSGAVPAMKRWLAAGGGKVGSR